MRRYMGYQKYQSRRKEKGLCLRKCLIDWLHKLYKYHSIGEGRGGGLYVYMSNPKYQSQEGLIHLSPKKTSHYCNY